MVDPTVRSFDPDQTRQIVHEARRTGKNPVTAIREAYGVTRSTAGDLMKAVDDLDRDKPWQPAEQPHDDMGDMPLRPGDVLAAGLDNGRCPVGVVTAVDEHAVRLDLYSWVTGEFSAGTAIVRHEQVREFSDLAVTDDGGVFQMDQLAAFQTVWTEGRR